MALAALAVEGGFQDPVFDAQAVFRRLMDAFAEPGRMADLSGRAAAPAPLGVAAAAVLAALADGDTPVWLPDPDATSTAAADWLRFHTGAPVVADPADASFAVLPEGDDPAGWARFPQGTSAYPDRAATLILPVTVLDESVPSHPSPHAEPAAQQPSRSMGGSLDPGRSFDTAAARPAQGEGVGRNERSYDEGVPLVLTGPGIAAERRIAVAGLPAGFVAAMAENWAGFPLGFDLILVCGGRALALPRTTRIRET